MRHRRKNSKISRISRANNNQIRAAALPAVALYLPDSKTTVLFCCLPEMTESVKPYLSASSAKEKALLRGFSLYRQFSIIRLLFPEPAHILRKNLHILNQGIKGAILIQVQYDNPQRHRQDHTADPAQLKSEI